MPLRLIITVKLQKYMGSLRAAHEDVSTKSLESTSRKWRLSRGPQSDLQTEIGEGMFCEQET